MLHIRSITTLIRKHWAIIFLIMIGSILRLYNIKPTISFMGDQGRDVRIVRDLIQKADPILVGPTTSVGKIQLGPLYYYYMSPWLWLFNFDPVGPAVGVALLGIVTIPILYYVLRHMFDERVALIASAMYTFSAVVIQNTRNSWNPNPMPLFAILLLYSLYQAYVHKKGIHLTLCFLWLSIALQLHYMIILVLPFFALMILLVFKEFKDKREFAAAFGKGLLVFLVLLLPLAVFDLRHEFLNTKGFLEFFQKGHHSPQAWYQPILDLEGRTHTSIGNILGLDKNHSIRNKVAILLLLSGLVYGFIRRKNKAVQLLLLYTMFSLAGMSLYRGDIFNHYMGFFFPVPFMLLGIILSTVYSYFKKGGVFLVGICVVAFIIIQVQQYDFLRPLGWQLQDIQNTSAEIASDAQGSPYNVVLLDDSKDYRAMNYRYFLEQMPNPPVNELNYSGIDTVYIISTFQDLARADLHVWELETFIGQEIDNLQDPQAAVIITDKISRSWKYPEGPWVYKIVRE